MSTSFLFYCYCLRGTEGTEFISTPSEIGRGNYKLNIGNNNFVFGIYPCKGTQSVRRSPQTGRVKMSILTYLIAKLNQTKLFCPASKISRLRVEKLQSSK